MASGPVAAGAVPPTTSTVSPTAPPLQTHELPTAQPVLEARADDRRRQKVHGEMHEASVQEHWSDETPDLVVVLDLLGILPPERAQGFGVGREELGVEGIAVVED